ncbi:hypothetical protein DFJ74DRAFT_696648 [Hyaloraphidium curvatum]|nr:hypothetical protein DFJ74DRAFT_696648 [Hyaloraphidium curvatum]
MPAPRAFANGGAPLGPPRKSSAGRASTSNVCLANTPCSADCYGFDGSKAAHAGLLNAWKFILADGDSLFVLICTNDPTEVEGAAEGFVGFSVEEEDTKMQTAALRKLKKTVKSAQEKSPKKIDITVKTTSHGNPGEFIAEAAPGLGVEALIVGYDEKHGMFSHPSNAEHVLKHSSIPTIVVADHAGTAAIAL